MPRWKRAGDLALVTLALPLALVVTLLLAFWIRLVSPGTVLFRQVRVGKGGRRFTIYKFRSMHMQAPTKHHEDHVCRLIRSNGPMTKLDVVGDNRLIRGGQVIRMLGLDELPQLLNVLRGEMSLVGPRPCLPRELEFYADDELRRFAVEPGLTGLWQVERNERTTFRQMLELDERYISERTLLSDLGLMLRTPVALIHQFATCRRLMAARRQRPERAPLGSATFGSLREPLRATQKLD